MSIFSRSPKHQEQTPDEFDFDKELDVDPFEFDSEPPPDDRNPSMKVLDGMMTGIESGLKDSNFLENLFKDVLPSGYGETYDMAKSVSRSAQVLYGDAVKEVKPAIKEFKKLTTQIIPAESKYVPKSVKDLMQKWKSEPNDEESVYRAPSKTDIQNSFIESQLSSVMKATLQRDEWARERQESQDDIEKGIQQKRHTDMLTLVSQIQTDTSKMEQLGRNVSLELQKKQLEAAYRTLFAIQDLVKVGDSTGKMTLDSLPKIVKNTGLPEFVKQTNVEFLKEYNKQKIVQTIGDNLFGGANAFIETALKDLKEKATSKLNGLVSGFKDGVRDAADMHEQAKDAATMAEEAGMPLDGKVETAKAAGSFGTQWLGKKVGKRIREYGVTRDRKVNTRWGGLNDKLNAALDYGSEKINSGSEWLISKRNNAGADLRKFKDDAMNNWDPTLGGMVKQELADFIPSSGVDTRVADRSTGKLDMPTAGMTKRTERSINEIIPGYLARILREIQIFRTGDESIELTEVDQSTGKLIDRSEKLKRLVDTVVGEREKRGSDYKFKEMFAQIDPEGKLSEKAKTTLKEKMMNGSINDKHFNRENYAEEDQYWDTDHETRQEITSHMSGRFDELEGNQKKLNEVQSGYFKLREAIKDPRKIMEELNKLGHGRDLIDLGLMDERGQLDPQKIIDLTIRKTGTSDLMQSAQEKQKPTIPNARVGGVSFGDQLRREITDVAPAGGLHQGSGRGSPIGGDLSVSGQEATANVATLPTQWKLDALHVGKLSIGELIIEKINAIAEKAGNAGADLLSRIASIRVPGSSSSSATESTTSSLRENITTATQTVRSTVGSHVDNLTQKVNDGFDAWRTDGVLDKQKIIAAIKDKARDGLKTDELFKLIQAYIKENKWHDPKAFYELTQMASQSVRGKKKQAEEHLEPGIETVFQRQSWVAKQKERLKAQTEQPKATSEHYDPAPVPADTPQGLKDLEANSTTVTETSAKTEEADKFSPYKTDGRFDIQKIRDAARAAKENGESKDAGVIMQAYRRHFQQNLMGPKRPDNLPASTDTVNSISTIRNDVTENVSQKLDSAREMVESRTKEATEFSNRMASIVEENLRSFATEVVQGLNNPDTSAVTASVVSAPAPTAPVAPASTEARQPRAMEVAEQIRQAATSSYREAVSGASKIKDQAVESLSPLIPQTTSVLESAANNDAQGTSIPVTQPTVSEQTSSESPKSRSQRAGEAAGQSIRSGISAAQRTGQAASKAITSAKTQDQVEKTKKEISNLAGSLFRTLSSAAKTATEAGIKAAQKASEELSNPKSTTRVLMDSVSSSVSEASSDVRRYVESEETKQKFRDFQGTTREVRDGALATLGMSSSESNRTFPDPTVSPKQQKPGGSSPSPSAAPLSPKAVPIRTEAMSASNVFSAEGTSADSPIVGIQRKALEKLTAIEKLLQSGGKGSSKKSSWIGNLLRRKKPGVTQEEEQGPEFEPTPGAPKKGLIRRGLGMAGSTFVGINKAAWWATKKQFQGIGWLGKKALGLGPRDVYLHGEDDEPKLTADGFKKKLYYDAKSGKPLNSHKDIQGEVKDFKGNVLLKEDEIPRLYYQEGVVKKLLNGATATMGALTKGVGKVVGAIAKATPAMLTWQAKLVGKAVKLPWTITKGAYGLLDRPKDIYVKGLPNPVLMAAVMKAGGYVSKVSQKPILKPSQIDGAVMDLEGNEILTHDMLQQGLVDENGKKIKTPMQKLLTPLTAIGKALWKTHVAAWGVTKKLTGAMWRGGKRVLSAVGGAAGRVAKGGWEKIFGEGPILGLGMSSQKTNDILTDIYSLLDARMPGGNPKSKNDKDGDGDRDGSWQDQRANTAAEGKKSLKDRIKGGIQKIKDKVDDKKKSLFEGIGDMISGIRGIMDMGKGILGAIKGLSKLSGFTKLLGMAAKLAGFGGVASGLMGTGAAAAATGAAGVAGTAAAGAAAAGAATAGAAAAGGAATVAGGTAAVGGGSALLALLTNPVTIAAVGVGLAAYGGYKLYQHFKYQLTPQDKIRLVQYGLNASDKDGYKAILSMERYLEPLVGSSGDGVKIDESKFPSKEIMGLFGLDHTDPGQAQHFFDWYQRRFKPVYLMSAGALKQIAGSYSTDKISSLDKDKILQYIDLAKFPDGPYHLALSPYLDYKFGISSGGHVQAIIRQVMQELGLDKIKRKPGAALEPVKINAERPVDPHLQPDGKPSKESAGDTVKTDVAFAGSKITVEAAVASYSAIKQEGHLGALDAVKFKAYGLTELTAEKVRILKELESAISEGTTSKAGSSSWNGNPEVLLEKMSGLFGIVDAYYAEGDDWKKWFQKRFLPIWLKFHSLYVQHTGKSNYSGNVADLKPDQQYDTAKQLAAMTDCWDITASPFPNYRLNTDPTTTKNNLTFLEEIVKKVKLMEDARKAAPPAGPRDTAEASKAIKDKLAGTTNAKPRTFAEINAERTQTAAVASDGEVKPASTGGGGGASSATPGVSGGSVGTLNMAGGALSDGRNGFSSMIMGPKVIMEGMNPTFVKLLSGAAEEYKQLTGKKLRLNEATRTHAEQVRLRQIYGKGAAVPGESLHGFGFAVDAHGPDLTEMDKLGLLKKYGLTRPVGGEDWHLEPVGIQLGIGKYKDRPELADAAIAGGVGRGGGGWGSIRGTPLGSRNLEMATKILQAPATPNVSTKPADPAAPSPSTVGAATPAAGTASTGAKPGAAGTISSPGGSTTPGSTGEKGAAKPMAALAQAAKAVGTMPSAPASKSRFETISLDSAAPASKVEGEKKPDSLALPSSVKSKVESAGAGGAAPGVKPIMAMSPPETNPNPGMLPPLKTGSKQEVAAMVASAAKMVGAPVDLAVATVAVESGFDPKAGTQGVTGLGLNQFMPGTWKETVDKYGSKYKGMSFDNPKDGPANALMGAHYVKDAEARIKQIVPNPTPTDIHLGHFFGPYGAEKFLKHLKADDSLSGARIFPGPSQKPGNSSVFFKKGGGTKTLREIYNEFAEKLKTKAAAHGVNIAAVASNAPSAPSPSGKPAPTESASPSTDNVASASPATIPRKDPSKGSEKAASRPWRDVGSTSVATLAPTTVEVPQPVYSPTPVPRPPKVSQAPSVSETNKETADGYPTMSFGDTTVKEDKRRRIPSPNQFSQFGFGDGSFEGGKVNQRPENPQIALAQASLQPIADLLRDSVNTEKDILKKVSDFMKYVQERDSREVKAGPSVQPAAPVQETVSEKRESPQRAAPQFEGGGLPSQTVFRSQAPISMRRNY